MGYIQFMGLLRVGHSRVTNTLEVMEKQQSCFFSPQEVSARGPGFIAAVLTILVTDWAEGHSWVAPPEGRLCLSDSAWAGQA